MRRSLEVLEPLSKVQNDDGTDLCEGLYLLSEESDGLADLIGV